MAKIILDYEETNFDGKAELAEVLYANMEGTGGGVILTDGEGADTAAVWQLDVEDAKTIRGNIMYSHEADDTAFGTTTYWDVVSWLDELITITKERKKKNPGTIEIVW
jgi:hypothetical protein